jgi:hypothetical protein
LCQLPWWGGNLLLQLLDPELEMQLRLGQEQWLESPREGRVLKASCMLKSSLDMRNWVVEVLGAERLFELGRNGLKLI